MATHSRVLAWRIPGTGESSGLPPMGSHRVRHDWSDLAAAAAVTCDVEHIFISLLAIWIFFFFFFSEVSEQIFSSFLKSFFSFSYWRILSSFYILANSLLHMSFANVFSQFICLVCHFLNNIFHWEEVFNFNEIQLIKYFFHRSCF